ncbi:MAG TPA: 6-pyruvoyl-tetrahydropterin synthase-related protein [Blastocatellia bacterium]
MIHTIAVKSDITESRGRINKRLGVLFALLVMAAIATLPFFVIGEDQKVGCCGGETPVTHDSWMHFNQMRAFYRGLESGRLYPRWDDETHGGYGAPTLAFYPPGAYYVTSVLYFLTRDWSKVWIGFYWLASFASAAAIYLYARRTMSRAAGLTAAAVYVFAPYHLINQYQRGAMAEFLSFVWTPLVLLFAERLLDTEGVSAQFSRRAVLNFAGLSASFGAFLWSHPPTAYQFLLVFGPCFVLWAISQMRYERKRLRELLVAGCALAFGFMIAAAYFFPAITERKLINYDEVEITWPYHASYVYDFGQKVYDHAGDLFFIRLDRIWAFNALAILLLGGALTIGFYRSYKSLSGFSRLWIGAGLIACFLMTKYSEPIGRLIPKIEVGVYSWRMMTLTSFVVAALAGACFGNRGGGPAVKEGAEAEYAPPRTLGLTAGLPPLASLTVLIGALAMSAWYVAWPMWRAQSFEPNPEHYNLATLPRGVPHEARPMDQARLAAGNGRVTIERWAPEMRRLRVEMEKPDQLQFRTSNFAGWTAIVDHRPVEIKEGAVKNIVIDLPAGEHKVELELRSTPVRRAGAVVTMLSLALLFSIIVTAIRLK